jgi:hypothetical protein
MDLEKKYYIYEIEGRKIGCTNDLNRRRREYRRDLNDPDFDFDHILYETDDIIFASYGEQFFQIFHGYKVDQTPYHVNNNPEALIKSGKTLKGRFVGEKHPMFGKTGEKNHMFGKTGEKHPRYGKTHSEKSRAKISAALKGKMVGDKNPMFGRTGDKNPMFERTGDKHPHFKYYIEYNGKQYLAAELAEILEVSHGTIYRQSAKTPNKYGLKRIYKQPTNSY